MIVKIKHMNPEYPDLTPDQPYLVIEADDVRLLNDLGRPYLYPLRLFQVVDAQEPDIWVNEYGEEGERYAYPRPLNDCGFFEDFFDEDQEAVTTFWRVVNEHLATPAVAGGGRGNPGVQLETGESSTHSGDPLPEGRQQISEEFIHHLETGEPLHETLQVGMNLDVMAIVDAGIRSADSGQQELVNDANWTIGK